MAVQTGNTGSLLYNGIRIAKVKNFSFSTQRGALDTTGVGDLDRTFISGVRQSSASGTILYDPDDSATVALLSSIYGNSTGVGPTLSLLINSGSGLGISAAAVLTEVGISVPVGDVVAANCSFQLSGTITENL